MAPPPTGIRNSLQDVIEGWESKDRARALYRVALIRGADGTLAVDMPATRELRQARIPLEAEASR